MRNSNKRRQNNFICTNDKTPTYTIELLGLACWLTEAVHRFRERVDFRSFSIWNLEPTHVPAGLSLSNWLMFVYFSSADWFLFKNILNFSTAGMEQNQQKQNYFPMNLASNQKIS